MRQLRFVRIADDGTQLLLATQDGAETFLLHPDVAVRDALRMAPRPEPEAAPVVDEAAPVEQVTRVEQVTQVEIGPREIQVRVRAGESPEELADSLGVPLSRISRFAAPVVDERHRIADEARRARARRSSDTDGAVVIFGEAVDARFAAHGIDAAEVGWDALRREDGEWVVIATWLGGEETRHARWVFSRAARLVTPTDDTAADLLSDRPIRPVVPLPVEPERPELAAAPPLAPGIVAFPPMEDTATGPLPPVGAEQVFDQEAAPPVFDDASPTGFEGPPLNFDAPPLPLGITDPATRPAAAGGRLATVRNLGRRDESDEDRAARAKIPSWDDILLGVRRKQE